MGRGDGLLRRSFDFGRDPRSASSKAIGAFATRCASCSPTTADFDARRDAVPVAELLELDRYQLGVANAISRICDRAYDRYEFHSVVRQLQLYCSEELGGFYLDVLKDRLIHRGHPIRRAAFGADGAGATFAMNY